MIDKNNSISFELEKEIKTENDKNNVAYKICTLVYKALQIICNMRERERGRERERERERELVTIF